MNLEQPGKEKKRGREARLKENEEKVGELNRKRQNNWVTEEEYRAERAKLEEEREDILTDPSLG